jgi:hypothetical protein
MDCCPHLSNYCSMSLPVVLNCQLGTIWQPVVVTAVKSDVIRTHIIVIIDLEFQADLCDAIQIDVLKSRTVQPGVIPATQGIVFDQANRILVRRTLEV